MARDPITIPPHAAGRSALILAVTGTTLLGLAFQFLHGRYQWILDHPEPPPTSFGEGMVISSDGCGYYAWLRSLLIDGDWSFDNEFDDHKPSASTLPGPWDRTDLGRRRNQWSVGPSCVWALTIVPAHLALRMASFAKWPADGYSLPYQVLVAVTTLLGSLVGLGFLYRTCRIAARPERAALTAALIALGTTIAFFATIATSMAHGLATAALAAFVWYWFSSFGSKRSGRWFVVGTLLGLAALMRWQLATYALLPAGEILLESWPIDWRDVRARIWRSFLAAAGFFVTITPQLWAWHCVYGSWFATPLPLERNWLQPRLWEVLASTDRSLFYWTPVALLAALGLAFGRTGQWRIRRQLTLLLIGFAAQVYALASISGNGVSLGASFGYRFLTESCVVLAPGLAVLLESAGPMRYRCLVIVGCLLAFWNMLLIAEFCHFLIPVDAGAGPGQLLKSAIAFTHRRPLNALILVPGPLCVALLAWHRRPVVAGGAGCVAARAA